MRQGIANWQWLGTHNYTELDLNRLFLTEATFGVSGQWMEPCPRISIAIADLTESMCS
jgi:hypothetical protein